MIHCSSIYKKIILNQKDTCYLFFLMTCAMKTNYITKHTNTKTRQIQGNTGYSCRASRKANINNLMCLFPNRHNTDTQVDVKEERGNYVIKCKYSYCGLFIYKNDNNNKDANCHVITPELLFRWVFRSRDFIHVDVLKTVTNFTSRLVFGTVPPVDK